MALPSPASFQRPPGTELLSRLEAVAGQRDLGALAGRLAELAAWVSSEMREFEAELGALRRGPRAVQLAAHHLLDLDGKHVRPMCVVLAARMGSGFDARARQLALAVELVHSATLLHDDVVDLGTTRRGAPAARAIWGNAASIFAGDWLLIEALRQIRCADVAGLLDDMLAIIDEMILAESLQLEQRGRASGSLGDYFAIVEGKTAALFRWAMRAGARAGGLSDVETAALERYGLHLGVAFQAVDDLLDVDGDVSATGKQLFADIREGKLTYPLLVALERDPELGAIVERCIADAADDPPPAALRAVLGSLRDTGALADCRDLARRRAEAAMEALSRFPDTAGKRALVTVAEATAQRDR